MPLLALLHPAQQIGWTNWTVHPSTVVGLGALGALYLWRARVLEREERAETRGDSAEALVALATRIAEPSRRAPSGLQRFAFFTGLFVMFASLNGPLHDLSDYYLFAAHMVQHLLLALVVAPLLVGGLTGAMLRPLIRRPAVLGLARWATRAPMAFVLFNVTMAAWHVPEVYGTAMAYHPVHIAQHLTMLATAVLMWWPILSPLPELPRLAYPGQMLYCFLMTLPMSIVAIYITMADHVLYTAYASAPRVWALSPQTDQYIGGLIMWIPGGLFFYGVMTFVFFKWAQRQEDTTASAQVDWRPAGA
ncbi:MAG: Cytochrome c oxidase caa3-type assembly factor CtaG_BS (unrelated to Cox11-CtaG family) [uncultured Gemmatimonadaceae bacterium]|uniref:Cytochrome c oxidase caa3-type assembly factor CtaG_BS (Unrelated to Cox11-CtaG family) n=1 Tax=uncultured Gemmatimonadaceae bacterium TaxID=246130 RepID=A0A6J4JYC5_9BACT|nr:MAG: Cytochrome c oxidase caa3-type assembly factor CtaG_BS (unrelated to Cox11-CtaG family) [uncultured Gemmatimonadaceae bacterium]